MIGSFQAGLSAFSFLSCGWLWCYQLNDFLAMALLGWVDYLKQRPELSWISCTMFFIYHILIIGVYVITTVVTVTVDSVELLMPCYSSCADIDCMMSPRPGRLLQLYTQILVTLTGKFIVTAASMIAN